MNNKKKRKLNIVILAGMVMLSLTACSSVEKPIDAYKDAYEKLGNVIEISDIEPMINEINSLVNYRYSPFDINVNDFRYISPETLTKISERIKAFGQSEFYDITEIYENAHKGKVDYIVSLGGVISDNGDVTYPNGVQATILSDESVEIETESVETEELPNEPGDTEEIEEITIEAEAIYYVTGKPPVELDGEGLPIDEDGNIVIEEGTDGDPRINPIIDLDGNVLWKGCSVYDLEDLTNEDNRAFMRALKQMTNITFEVSNEHKVLFEEQMSKNLKEQEYDMDDGLGDMPIIHEDDIVYSMYEFNTSGTVQKFGDKYGIPWNYILDGYNRNTGRYEYEVLDQVYYIDVATIYVPISAYKGDIEYNFKLMDYRVLDSGQILLFYESKKLDSGLANALTITGNIENGKFVADDILNFTNFYNK